VNVKSFQLVTGRKTDHLLTCRESDHWMLNTISALIVAMALVFIISALRKRVPLEVGWLGCLSALALASVDIVYVARGTIWPIYLADAGSGAVYSDPLDMEACARAHNCPIRRAIRRRFRRGRSSTPRYQPNNPMPASAPSNSITNVWLAKLTWASGQGATRTSSILHFVLA